MGTFAVKFMERLGTGMEQRGFSAVTKERVDGKLRDSGFLPQGRASGIIESGETIFTRSGTTSGKSNFSYSQKLFPKTG